MCDKETIMQTGRQFEHTAFESLYNKRSNYINFHQILTNFTTKYKYKVSSTLVEHINSFNALLQLPTDYHYDIFL